MTFRLLTCVVYLKDEIPVYVRYESQVDRIGGFEVRVHELPKPHFHRGNAPTVRMQRMYCEVIQQRSCED